MSAITLRNLPPAVAKAVKQRARREGLSLNKAVAQLLEEATGVDKAERKGVTAHHDLDKFFGTWTSQEADAFDSALREQRQIEAEMWK